MKDITEDDAKGASASIRSRCRVCLFLDTYKNFILFQLRLKEEAEHGKSLFWYGNTKIAVREVHDSLARDYREILILLYKSICKEYNNSELDMLTAFVQHQKLLKIANKGSESNYKFLGYTLLNIEEMCRGLKIIGDSPLGRRLPLKINLSCIPFIQMAQDTILTLRPVDEKGVFDKVKEDVTFDYKFNKRNTQ